MASAAPCSMLSVVLLAFCLVLAVECASDEHHSRHHSRRKQHLRRGIVDASSVTNVTAAASTEDDDTGDDDDDDDDDAADASAPLKWEINPSVAAANSDVVPMNAIGDGSGTEVAKEKLQAEVHEKHEKLAENLREQVAVNAEVKELDNVEAGHRLIDASVQAVANETQSPAMASFLGDMWKEMRMFAKPFYKEHLEEKLGHLEEQNSKLQAEFSDAQTSLTAWKPNAVTTLTYSADSLAFGPGAPEPNVA